MGRGCGEGVWGGDVGGGDVWEEGMICVGRGRHA